MVSGKRAEVDSKGRPLRTRAFWLLRLSRSKGHGVFREHYVWFLNDATGYPVQLILLRLLEQEDKGRGGCVTSWDPILHFTLENVFLFNSMRAYSHHLLNWSHGISKFVCIKETSIQIYLLWNNCMKRKPDCQRTLYK